jgi:multidrug efflux system membrane fusion protein
VFTGRVSRIAPFADPKSRVFEVEVTVPNEQSVLKVGMVASLQLAETAPMQSTTLLPLAAIVRAPGKPKSFAVYVFDQKSQKVAVREVELGEFLGNMIPVKSGLKEGETVVVMGANLLSDGDSVLVLP